VIDLSQSLPPTWTYPGDPETSVEAHATHGAEGYRVSRLTTGTHAGTHVDAPAHTEPDGATLGAFPVERFRWRTLRVDCTDLDARAPVPAERLPPAEATADVDLLAVHTGWDRHWGTERYRDHPWLAPAAARECARRGLDVAVDAPSVDPTPPAARTAHATGAGEDAGDPGDPETEGGSGATPPSSSGVGGPSGNEAEGDHGDGRAAHHAILGAGRLVVENLTGLGATPERFDLWAPPLALDADAAPARAVAVVE
jgi:kynurenine formamidase